MRILTHLEAQEDCGYQATFHAKLRGRVWAGVRGSEYDSRHDEDRPLGLTFSNPFPVEDIEEGEERKVLLASPDEELLATVAADFLDDRQFNIGEHRYRVDSISDVYPDVGEPGTSGVLESATGVCVSFGPTRREEYGIDAPDGARKTFWQPEHSLGAFEDAVERNLDWKHDLYCPDHLAGPAEFDAPLFDEYEMLKQFAVPITVSEGETHPFVLSKWRLHYTVRDDDHRRHLNLALDTGIGEKNGYGLGFLNDRLDEKEAAA